MFNLKILRTQALALTLAFLSTSDDREGRRCAAMAQSHFWADQLLRSNSASKILS